MVLRGLFGLVVLGFGLYIAAAGALRGFGVLIGAMICLVGATIILGDR